MKIGLQVYSVRDFAEKDFAGTMREVKEMGYDGVELAGLYGLEPAYIKGVLDALGLECVSAHVPYADMIADIDSVIDTYLSLGCTYMAIPYMNDNDRPGKPAFGDVVKSIENIGKKCREKNLVLLYHNHDFEFVKVEDGSFGLDYLYSNVSPEYLQTELDTCWVKVSGQSPDGYIRKYKGRCPVVHLKDYSGQKSDNMYELIGIEKKASASEEFKFQPVGYGLQNFPEVCKAAVESGAEWMIVEQDSSKDRPSIDAVRLSRDYLRSIGF